MGFWVWPRDQTLKCPLEKFSITTDQKNKAVKVQNQVYVDRIFWSLRHGPLQAKQTLQDLFINKLIDCLTLGQRFIMDFAHKKKIFFNYRFLAERKWFNLKLSFLINTNTKLIFVQFLRWRCWIKSEINEKLF